MSLYGYPEHPSLMRHKKSGHPSIGVGSFPVEEVHTDRTPLPFLPQPPKNEYTTAPITYTPLPTSMVTQQCPLPGETNEGKRLPCFMRHFQ